MWYIAKIIDGRRFALWKSHDNGPSEGFFLDEHPNRRPKLFATLEGAERRAQGPEFVFEWHGATPPAKPELPKAAPPTGQLRLFEED